jgi:hypothetical protein
LKADTGEVVVAGEFFKTAGELVEVYDVLLSFDAKEFLEGGVDLVALGDAGLLEPLEE